MTQAICDITTDEVNVDVVVEHQADTMVEVANRAGGMEQVFHDNTLIGNGNSVDLGVNTDIIATKEYSDEQDTLLRNEINGKLTAIDSQIDANADAIQKTREDYIQADSEIHQILNNHASELTTLRGNQASLGDQVSGIEEKIPESASGSNPLVTKQQLLDEEMDIRDDLNEGLSELQTQITAQAAEIATKQDQLTAGDNIIISGNIISATGAGGGVGFDVIVVQELPESGEKGIIYLVPKDSAAPDVYDEYVWVTTTSTFELIGSTAVDLSGYATKDELGDYLPLAGGTMSGEIFMAANGSTNTYNIKFANPDKPNDSNYYYQIGRDAAGTDKGFGIRVNQSSSHARYFFTLTSFCALPNQSGAKIDLGNTAKPWKTIYVKAMNNGADLAVPTEGGTLARVEDITDAVANIDALPAQSGNAGKFLQTDGSTASWSDVPPSTRIIFREWE